MNRAAALYYLAGIIDGEGHVKLRGDTSRARRFWNRNISITNTDPGIIEATCEALAVLGVEYHLSYRKPIDGRKAAIDIRIYGRENFHRLRNVPLRGEKRARLRIILESFQNPPVPTREELLELLATHGTERASADAVGVTKSTIQYWKRVHRVPSNRILPVPTEEELEALIRKHGSERKAAAATGHARKTIRRWRRLHESNPQ